MAITLDGTTGITTPGLTNTGTETIVNLTTTGNTILGNTSTDTLNVGNGDLVKDASGNVGIGVTPSAWGSPLSHAIELVQGTGITAHSGSATSYYTSNAYYNGSNWIYKSSVKATLMTMSGSDGSFGWNTAPSGTAGNPITFTQAMTLDASGRLTVVGGTASFRNDINTANESMTLVANAATSTNQYGYYAKLAGDPNNTSNYFLSCDGNATSRAVLRSNGGLANFSANNVNLSDRREKTNFAPAENYLDKICAIPVQTFNYIDQNMEEDDGLTLGVVAQDVQAICPEMVMESNWAGKDEPEKLRLSIYQTDLQYALMKSIQELNAKFEEYKASHP